MEFVRRRYGTFENIHGTESAIDWIVTPSGYDYNTTGERAAIECEKIQRMFAGLCDLLHEKGCFTEAEFAQQVLNPGHHSDEFEAYGEGR